MTEVLEVRQLLSTPTIAGTSANETWYVRVNPDDGGEIQVYPGDEPTGTPTTYDRSDVTSLTINGNGGTDKLIVDYTHGTPVTGTLNFNSTATNNTVELVGRSNLRASYEPNASIAHKGNVVTALQTLSFTGVGTVTMAGFSGVTASPGTSFATAQLQPDATSGQNKISLSNGSFYAPTLLFSDTPNVEFGSQTGYGPGNITVTSMNDSSIENFRPYTHGTVTVSGGNVPISVPLGAPQLTLASSADVTLIGNPTLYSLHIANGTAVQFSADTVRVATTSLLMDSTASLDLGTGYITAASYRNAVNPVHGVSSSAPEDWVIGYSGVPDACSPGTWCSATVKPVQQYDFNMDGVVNTIDLSGVLNYASGQCCGSSCCGSSCCGSSCCGSSCGSSCGSAYYAGAWSYGDLNYDGYVDDDEISTISQVDFPCSGSEAAPLPTQVATTVSHATSLANEISLAVTYSPSNSSYLPFDYWFAYWGDGTMEQVVPTDGSNGSQSATLTHRYDLSSLSITLFGCVDGTWIFVRTISSGVPSISPKTLTQDSPTTANEGELYTLTLKATNITSGTWSIDWGDGSAVESSDAITSSTLEKTHQFASGIPSSTVQVTAVSNQISYGGWKPAPIDVDVTPAPPADVTAYLTEDGLLQVDWTDESVIEQGFDLQWSSDSEFTTDVSSVTVGQNSTSAGPCALTTEQAAQCYARVRSHTSTSVSPWVDVTVAEPAAALTQATLAEGTAATLTLTGKPSGADWVIDWGDGEEDTTSQTDTVLQHQYACPSALLRVSLSFNTALHEFATFPVQIVSNTPTDLTATAVSGHEISLSWTDTSDIETGFEVQQSDDAMETWTSIGMTDPSETESATITFTATGPFDPGQVYYFRVTAITALTESDPTDPVSVTMPSTIPLPPIELEATTTSGDVTLTWTLPDADPDRTGFTIERSLNGGPWIDFLTGQDPSQTTATDSSAPDGALCQYRVYATGSTSDSAYALMTVLVPDPTPADLVVASPSTTSIRLAWDGSPFSPSALSGYRIDRSAGGQVTSVTVSPDAQAYEDSGLTPGTTYSYTILAVSIDQFTATLVGTADVTLPDTLDHTPPSAPSLSANGQTLSWNYISDAAAYRVYRDQRCIATVFAGTLMYYESDTAYSTAAYHYQYQVSAVDAAGNESALSGTVALSFESSEDPLTDTAPDQYVPQAYQDFLYDQIIPALRNRAAAISAPFNSTAGEACIGDFSGWLNLSLLSEVYGIATDAGQDAAYFSDRNNNDVWDPGEWAWRNDAQGIKHYDTDINPDREPSWNAAEDYGTPLQYLDINHNGNHDGNEPYLQLDLYAARGETGLLAYASTGQAWQSTDTVWVDLNGNGLFDTAEPILHQGIQSLEDGDVGRSRGLYYIDLGDNEQHEYLYWYDPHTFHDDFVSVYATLEALIPQFMDTSHFDVPSFVALDWTKETLLGQTDWTLIPAHNGASAVFGTRETDSVMFREQFLEIANTIAKLATVSHRYHGHVLDPRTVYDATSSGAMKSLVKETVDAYEAIYGPSSDSYLRNLLASGRLDPGALREGATLTAVRNTILAIADVVRVRNGSGGWVYTTEGDPKVQRVATFADDLQWKALLPAMTIDGVQVRAEGNWSSYTVDGVPVSIGRASMNPDGLLEITEAKGVLDHILTNGLWIARNWTFQVPTTDYEAKVHDQQGGTNMDYTGEPPFDLPDVHRGTPESFAAHTSSVYDVTLDTTSTAIPTYGPNSAVTCRENGGVLAASVDFGYGEAIYRTLVRAMTDADTFVDAASSQLIGCHLAMSWFTYQALFPSADNENGGADFSDSIAFDMHASDLDAGQQSSLTNSAEWGTTWDIISLSDSDVMSLAEAYMAYLGVDQYLNHTMQDFDTDATELVAPVGTTDPYVDGPISVAGSHVVFGSFWPTPGHTINATAVYQNLNLVLSYAQIVPCLFGRIDAAIETAAYIDVDALPDLTMPGGEIPLTSVGDAVNEMPDTDLDGIVNVECTDSTLFAATGSIQFDPARPNAQVFVPLELQDEFSALPVHGYLSQGGFGDPDDPNGAASRSIFWLPSTIHEEGLPYVYSLDERVQTNIYLDDGGYHVKRVEVVRPRGNTVVFDFAYSSGSFSAVGYPTSYNNAQSDSLRQYVLRDLTPANPTDSSFVLEFASGIRHEFVDSACVTSVSDNAGNRVTVAPARSGSLILPTNESGAWDATIAVDRGRLSDITYETKGGSESIKTVLNYADDPEHVDRGVPAVIVLAKTDADHNSIESLSYSYDASTDAITHAGVTIAQTRTPGNTTYVGYVTSVDGTVGSLSEQYTLNTGLRVTEYTRTLSGTGPGTSQTTSYQYTTETGRYTSDQALKAGKLASVQYPDGSWVRYEYDQTHGWIENVVTPFENAAIDAPDSNCHVVEYVYSGLNIPGDSALDGTSLSERPRGVITYALGQELGRTYYKYQTELSPSVAGPVISRQATLAGQSWADSGLEVRTVPHAYGPADVFSASGSVTYSSYTSSDPYTHISLLQITGLSTEMGGAEIATWQTQVLATGALILSQATDSATRYTVVDQSASGNIDPYGRVTQMTDALLGRDQVIDYNHTSGVDAYWLGPTRITGTDGVVTQLTYTPWGAIASSTSLDVTTAYTYDAMGNVIAATATALKTNEKRTTSSEYDSLGRLTKSIDEIGRTTTTVYTTATGGGLRTETTLSDNSTSIKDYYLDGSLAAVSGTAEIEVHYSSGVGLQDTEDPDWNSATGSVERSLYWTQSSANATGRQRTYYDALGRVVRQTDLGVSTSARSFYDDRGRLTRQVAFDGTQTLYAYNLRNELSEVALDVNLDGTIEPGLDRVTQYQSKLAQQMQSSIDQNGQGSTAAVNVFQMRTTIKGDSSTPDYTVVEKQAVNGMQTWVTEAGQMNYAELKWTPGEGAAKLKTLNSAGTYSMTSLSKGQADRMQQFGTTGRILADQSNERNAFGEVSSTRTQLGTGPRQTTGYARQRNGVIKDVALPDGTTASNKTLDKYNTTTSGQRPGGGMVYTPTNALGQTTSVSGSGVSPTSFQYDSTTGQRTSLTTYASGSLDGTGATTNWTFDPISGRLVSKSYAGSSSPDISYVYGSGTDPYLTSISRPGSTESLQYNDGTSGRPMTGDLYSVEFQNNGTAETAYTYSYDIFGRISSVAQTVGGSQTVTYSYNASSQKTSESQPWAAAGDLSAKYDYYSTGNTSGPAGAVKDVKISDGTNNAASVSYNYDSSSQRVQTISADDLSHTYTYLPNTNLISSLAASNNIEASYRYEADTGYLASVAYYCGTTTVLSISYEYNDHSQRETASVEQLLSNGQTEHITYHYEYDAQDHLTVVQAHTGDLTGPVDSSRSFTYSYDALGNRSATDGFQINDLNQYTSTLIPGLENQAPEYDDRGNMLSDGTRTLTYDAQDRLTSVILGDVKTTFEYDYLGRRTTKTVYDSDGNGGWMTTPRETRTFAYDGWNVMAEYLTDAEHSTATLARTYAWGPSLGGGIGGLLSVTDHLATGGPATYVPVFDGNGNVLALTDILGQVVASYQYDPYGKLISASDASTTWQADATGVLSAPAGSVVMADPFLFSTKYCDFETGLYDFGMRYYAPDLQRWINRDPIEESGGVNLYAYCGSDPVNRVDPDGLDSKDGYPFVLRSTHYKPELGFRPTIRDAFWARALTPEMVTTGLTELKLAIPPEGVHIGKLISDPEINIMLNFAFRGDVAQQNAAGHLTWLQGKRITHNMDAGGSIVTSADIDIYIGVNNAFGPVTRFTHFMIYGGGRSVRNIENGIGLGAMGSPWIKRMITEPAPSPDLMRSNGQLGFSDGGSSISLSELALRAQPTVEFPATGMAAEGKAITDPAHLLSAPARTRLPQDLKVNSTAPPALSLRGRVVGGTPAQNAALQADIRDAMAMGARDIRVNQQQVNSLGQRVGVNRPDLQYTRPDGVRIYIEYDNTTPGTFPNTPRGPGHAARILSNDPNGVVILKSY